MKKMISILLFLLLIPGCAKQNEEDVPIEPVDEEILVNPVIIGDDIISYLDGFWLLYTNDPETNMSVSLSFENGTVLVTSLDDNYIAADLSLFPSTFEEGDEKDALRFEVTAASSSLEEKYGNNYLIYSSDMQFYMATYQTHDFLFLRELGNGFSILDQELLGDERMTGDYGWVFVRDTHNSFPDPDENEKLKWEEGDHYAFAWMRNDEICLLQKVEIEEKDVEWFSDPIKVLFIRRSTDEFGNIAILYNGSYVPSQVRPGLVRVHIDGNGNITETKEIHYFAYGSYREE